MASSYLRKSPCNAASKFLGSIQGRRNGSVPQTHGCHEIFDEKDPGLKIDPPRSSVPTVIHRPPASHRIADVKKSGRNLPGTCGERKLPVIFSLGSSGGGFSVVSRTLRIPGPHRPGVIIPLGPSSSLLRVGDGPTP